MSFRLNSAYTRRVSDPLDDNKKKTSVKQSPRNVNVLCACIFSCLHAEKRRSLTDFVALARRTVRVALPLVVVVPAPFAVGSVAVACAVQTVSAVSGPFVQVFVEETPVRKPVAVTFWKGKRVTLVNKPFRSYRRFSDGPRTPGCQTFKKKKKNDLTYTPYVLR